MASITVDPTDSDAATSGDPVLDAMLAGGLPAERSTLAIGGPGTGKSTLAMQFLQAGLNRGDRCLFISTEQTPEELRSSFNDFAFDLGHDNLTITSVHAVTGRTLNADEELTIRTLDGGELVDTGLASPLPASTSVRHSTSMGRLTGWCSIARRGWRPSATRRPSSVEPSST